MNSREMALLISGGSGMTLAHRLATMALSSGALDLLHVVVTGAAGKVLSHELGPEWASARGFRDHLPLPDELRDRIQPWADTDLTASIASGSHRLADHRIDARNPRTAGRALPAGRLGRPLVWMVTLVSAATFVLARLVDS